MNQDTFLEIIKHSTPDNLHNLCTSNKYFYNVCNNNKEWIAKFFLDKYQVEYNDPTNFIYVDNRKNIKNYRKNGKWNFSRLFNNRIITDSK